MFLRNVSTEVLRHEIREIVVSTYLENAYLTILYELLEEEVSELDVLRPLTGT